MNKNMTIGFFGDSFCSSATNPFKLISNYETYIEMLAKHYNAKITTVGFSGSSIWDLYLLQLKPLIDLDKVPDVCVFVWTAPGRLFHRKYRNINHGTAENWKTNPFSLFDLDKRIWIAAKKFYKFLFDQEKENFEYLALMYYIDHVVLPKLKNTKIIHLWSFGNTFNTFKPSNITYSYNWTHGVEIRPSLVSISQYKSKSLLLDVRPNHLDGTKNQIVFNWVKSAIDNYSNKIEDYSKDIDKLWEKI